MKILYQIAIIFGLCLLGEIVSALLSFPFPSAISAMILLSIALFSGILKIDHIKEKSDFLLSNMAFFFIPAGVKVIEHFDLIASFWWQFIVIAIVGITISIVAYSIGVWINKKTKLAILNPLLISYLIIIPTLIILEIPLEWYERGGDIINMFLSPATAVLAITIYRQREILRKHILSVLGGTIAGSITSLAVVYLMCRMFILPDEITASMLPKSITTPMAIAVSESIGGIEAVTVLAVIITGISGNILSPILIRIFKVKNEIAQGMAIGASSHAVGTSKAIELGEVQGALSSIALVMSGIVTVILSLILFI